MKKILLLIAVTAQLGTMWASDHEENEIVSYNSSDSLSNNSNNADFQVLKYPNNWGRLSVTQYQSATRTTNIVPILPQSDLSFSMAGIIKKFSDTHKLREKLSKLNIEEKKELKEGSTGSTIHEMITNCDITDLFIAINETFPKEVVDHIYTKKKNEVQKKYALEKGIVQIQTQVQNRDFTHLKSLLNAANMRNAAVYAYPKEFTEIIIKQIQNNKDKKNEDLTNLLNNNEMREKAVNTNSNEFKKIVIERIQNSKDEKNKYLTNLLNNNEMREEAVNTNLKEFKKIVMAKQSWIKRHSGKLLLATNALTAATIFGVLKYSDVILKTFSK